MTPSERWVAPARLAAHQPRRRGTQLPHSRYTQRPDSRIRTGVITAPLFQLAPEAQRSRSTFSKALIPWPVIRGMEHRLLWWRYAPPVVDIAKLGGETDSGNRAHLGRKPKASPPVEIRPGEFPVLTRLPSGVRCRCRCGRMGGRARCVQPSVWQKEELAVPLPPGMPVMVRARGTVRLQILVSRTLVASRIEPDACLAASLVLIPLRADAPNGGVRGSL